ncbi:MAG TPA: M20/M25/M40 family metallo-hydrolase [Gemmataceae bacterium]|jgi:acetylornithine deacetylase/succinyl-diaminopimelate desuccinylase-like protein
MHNDTHTPERLRQAVNRQRLLDTAQQLVAVPSRTGEGGPVAERLAQLLAADGFTVERPSANHPSAPAVVVRLDSGKPGRTLQFNGHLDTVHLPFVPPAVENGNLTGSGSCDMKGGTAAAVEALRVLRDTGSLTAGAVLLTAHDLHEAPWGLGQQLNALIAEGYVGDAVLLPEPLCDRLPIAGRGSATWKIVIRRAGPPIHEVMRPTDEPSVLAAAAELIARLGRLNERLSAHVDPQIGSASVFIGQIHGGEIFNQYPQECWLEGTRRWLPGTSPAEVEREFRALLADLARDTRTTVDLTWTFIRDAFFLSPDDPLVNAFQQAYTTIGGQPLALGPKPFVDDGNSFYGLKNIPAITHGPRAGGQHTVNEWVDIDDLVRVAHLYALTAVLYCQEPR